MAVVTPALTSFNAGEISPRLWQRFDQNIRSIGVKRMDGWLPLLQGPAEACPGTLFVAKAKGPFRAIPYEFNVTQGYLVEAGETYLRFFTNNVQIESAPGVPYEIVSPWTLSQVRALYYHQSLDVLYGAVRDVPLQRLYRTSADTFAIEPYELRNGPFESRNSDKTVTVAVSATTGSITVTSTGAALFEAGDIGGLMEIEGGDFSGIPAWEAGIAVSMGSFCQSDGNVYQATGGTGRTGTTAPIHVEGTEYDGLSGTDINDKGPYGVLWTYLYNRYGLIRFTGFTSANVMTADVLTTLASTAGSYRWRFGAFSTRRGFPEAAGIWQERLVLSKDATIYASVAGELDNFALRNEFGDASRDMAFTIDMPDASKVRWLLTDLALIIGTETGEFAVRAASQGQGAGPGNTDTGTLSTSGGAFGKALLVDGRAVFLQRARGKLLQLAYDTNRLVRAESPNLSRFADHLANEDNGFNELAWCREPERLLWTRRDDGTLAVCAYDPDEQLLGWATRTLGGEMTATSIASITDPAGRYPQLWIGAQAGAEYWVMLMAPNRPTGNTDERVMLDAALRYQGAATAAVSAPHLAGLTVDICADGRPVMAVELDDAGAATLDFEAADIIVGLRFPAELEFLPPPSGSENGPAFGKAKRASRIDLSVINSDVLEIECQGTIELINLLQRSNALDQRRPLTSKRQQVEPRGDVDDEMSIIVRRLYPRPSTLALVMPYYDVAQA
jgi:hypothetical protein